jgi:peptidyl-tRNA hydrolase, PTH2 family
MVSSSNPDELKQVILVRMDLKMGKGKMCAQSAHASIESYLSSLRINPNLTASWYKYGMQKVALKVQDEKELVLLFQKAKDASLPCSLIQDAGHTQIAAGSKTCVGIGPARAGDIDKITGELPLL